MKIPIDQRNQNNNIVVNELHFIIGDKYTLIHYSLIITN